MKPWLWEAILLKISRRKKSIRKEGFGFFFALFFSWTFSWHQLCRMMVKSQDGRELRSFRFKDEDERLLVISLILVIPKHVKLLFDKYGDSTAKRFTLWRGGYFWRLLPINCHLIQSVLAPNWEKLKEVNQVELCWNSQMGQAYLQRWFFIFLFDIFVLGKLNSFWQNKAIGQHQHPQNQKTQLLHPLSHRTWQGKARKTKHTKKKPPPLESGLQLLITIELREYN